MNLSYLHNKFKENENKPAMAWQNKTVTYGWLLNEIKVAKEHIAPYLKKSGVVVEIYADFSPKAVAVLIALIEQDCIIVPLTKSVENKREEFQNTAEVELSISFDNEDNITLKKTSHKPNNPLLLELKTKQHPGLILFSSGSTGKSKAALHDMAPLLKKFETPRGAKRIMTFLLFDHIGGINTLLHTLYNAGCVVTVKDRKPQTICEAIQNFQVEVLPTSPTFLNLFLLSGEYKNYDLTSLDVITYGTETMPQGTLEKLHAAFPKVRLQQTYGLSEIGIMRSKSKSSDSLYMKIGGEDFQTRITNGLLEIKAKSAMLGYLNAPSPFTEDGWFITGDAVEVEGEYLKVLGRKSEIINIGGEKVYPTEIENVLQHIDGVDEVAVLGEPNPLTGNIVKAKIKLSTAETVADFRKRMRTFCKGKLASYKVPQKVILTDAFMHTDRLKKMRKDI